MPKLLALMALLLSGAARADAQGDARLAAVDAASMQVQDAHLVLEVTVEDRRGNAAVRTLEIWQKGSDKRLVRMTSPARLAGTGILVDGADDDAVIHLYLPAYGRTRRVIGDARGDAFLGTDIAMEDLARITWADSHSAVVEGVDGELTRLLLTPADGSLPVRLTVRADDQVQTVEHLDAQGAVSRRVQFDDFRAVDGRMLAHRFEISDLERSSRNVGQITSVALDQGLADSLFTVTQLSRP